MRIILLCYYLVVTNNKCRTWIMCHLKWFGKIHIARYHNTFLQQCLYYINSLNYFILSYLICTLNAKGIWLVYSFLQNISCNCCITWQTRLLIKLSFNSSLMCCAKSNVCMPVCYCMTHKLCLYSWPDIILMKSVPKNSWFLC